MLLRYFPFSPACAQVEDVGMELQFVVFVLLMRRKELGVGTRSETGRTPSVSRQSLQRECAR